MTIDAKNIDALIVQNMQEQATNSPPKPLIPDPPKSNEEAEPVSSQKSGNEESNESADQGEHNVPRETKEQTTETEKAEPEHKSDSPIDEYGNPIAPPKTYTEEEVNRMIRERLARGKQVEQAQQPVKQVPPQDQPQAGNDEAWKQELKDFVKNTYQEITKEQQEAQWQAEQLQKQAEFEDKFTTGMSKYSDFHQVTSTAPITSSMLMATRGLDNPAAFVYGAVKLYPQEIAKISQITDPYLQAAEIGRLHEKMVKTRSAVSNAPKPIENVKGDVPAKAINQQPSLEQRILEHARQKRR